MRRVRGVRGVRVVPAAAGGIVRVMGMVGVMAHVGSMGIVARGAGNRVAVWQGKEWCLSGARDRGGALRDRSLRPANTESRIRNRHAGALRQDRSQRHPKRHQYRLPFHSGDPIRTN